MYIFLLTSLPARLSGLLALPTSPPRVLRVGMHMNTGKDTYNLHSAIPKGASEVYFAVVR